MNEVDNKANESFNGYFEETFGKRIRLVSCMFPKGIPKESIVVKKQKNGKKGDSYTVKAALVKKDLFVNMTVRWGHKGHYGKKTIQIPNATNFLASEITYRMDLGVGGIVDAVRLANDAIYEIFSKNGYPISSPSILRSVNHNQRIATDKA